MLVAFDLETGFAVQSVGDPVHPDHRAVLEESGYGVIECSRDDFLIRGEFLSLHQLKVRNGKLVAKTKREMAPSAQQIRDNTAAEIDAKRLTQPIRPVHSLKLAAALSGNHDLLASEADARGITPSALAELVIEKASAALRAEAEFQQQIIKAEKV